jgi:hypothetical protein
MEPVHGSVRTSNCPGDHAMDDHEHESLHAALVAHLRRQAIEFTVDGAATVRFIVANPLGAIPVDCTVPTAGVLVVRSWYPHPIDDLDLPPVEQLCVRANARLQIGSLDVDRERAAVCFRAGVDFAGTRPDAAMIERALRTSIAGILQWSPPIAGVANGLGVDLAIQAVGP